MTEETTEKTITIAGVRFRENWKVYDFEATDLEITVGDQVIVDSERGPGFASVVRLRKAQASAVPEPAAPPEKEEIPEGIEIEIDAAEGQEPPASKEKGRSKGIRKVLRKATADDRAREEKNRGREAEAFSLAQDMIAEREMAMKLIRVEYSFDASRATFFFFSENRIDFRELVKDLAYKLKSRIEMRQIGVRDVARMIGGFGPCGRELCCSSFLKNFEPVSIRMAKKQEMVLNPAKISGVCGRLLCCLSYEYEMYEANKKDLADLRQTAVKEKKEEEARRVAAEADNARKEEERKRQEDRRHEQKQKQKEGGHKGGKHEKRKEGQEKKQQQPQGEQRQKQHQQQQPRPEKQQPQEQKVQPEQKAQTPQQEGEQKTGKRKRRSRFWRKKRKQQQAQGGGDGQAPKGGPQTPQSGGQSAGPQDQG